MLRQYEVYSCGNTGAEIYLKNPDLLKENEERTKEYGGDILLDIVWAEDEDDAVEIVANDEDVSTTALYALQHVVDAKPRVTYNTNEIIPRLEAGGFINRSENTFGFEILLPDQRILKLSFDEYFRIIMSIENPDEEREDTIIETDSVLALPQ